MFLEQRADERASLSVYHRGAIFGAFPLAYSPATAPSNLPSAFFKDLLNTKTNRETARAALKVLSIQHQQNVLALNIAHGVYYANRICPQYFRINVSKHYRGGSSRTSNVFDYAVKRN